VTRLRCGGFIFALRLNHCMSDAAGLTQFMSAVGEMARGMLAPSIPPVWERHLLAARDPPRVTCKHREYEEVEGTIVPFEDMAHRSFFFGPTEVSKLRKLVPQHLLKCSTFELLTACLWRCRTIAIQANPKEEVRIICIVNARSKYNPPLPSGYYGNAFAFPVAVAEAGKLCQNPLGYALELVKQAKADVTEEYMKSLADLMVIKGRPHFTVVRSYLVSDVTRAGFGDVDFGWGKAVYGGPAKGGVGAIPGLASFLIPFKNKKGEAGIVLPITLPAQAMEIFVKELDGMLKETPTGSERKSVFISSSMQNWARCDRRFETESFRWRLSLQSVYVSNLSDGVSRKDLWECFNEFGVVDDVLVLPSRRPYAVRSAFVRYRFEDKMRKALSRGNDRRLDGKSMLVRKANVRKVDRESFKRPFQYLSSGEKYDFKTNRINRTSRAADSVIQDRGREQMNLFGRDRYTSAIAYVSNQDVVNGMTGPQNALGNEIVAPIKPRQTHTFRPKERDDDIYLPKHVDGNVN
ncbi:hypothetical protein CCACVL1_03891, partial [Corchorus capsularis]